MKDVVKFEVILAKESDSLGLDFQVFDNQITVQHVDSLIKIISIHPDEIKSIEEGDVVCAINFTVLQDVDPRIVFESLATEIARSQKLVKLKMARYLPRALSPFILNITNMEGEIARLEVHPQDDIRQVLINFIELNKLPSVLLPSLLKKVSDEFYGIVENSVEVSEKMSLDELKFNRLRDSPISDLGVERTIRFMKKTEDESNINERKQSQNQRFFDRLHHYEEKKRDKLDLLRQKCFDEREEQLKSSSFRSQMNISETKLRPSQSSEAGLQNLYYDHMLWLRTRDKNLNRLKIELDQKKELELQSTMRSVPQLFTSPDMQRESSPSKSVLHQSLFDWNNYYKLRREHSAIKIMSTIDNNAYFIPKIDDRSRRLANKRIEKMKQWAKRSSSPIRFEHEFSNLYPSIFEEDSPYIGNPTGRYSFPTDCITGTEDAETTKIYSPDKNVVGSSNHLSASADMNPTQSPQENQQAFMINEVIINQLRNSPRPNRNTESNQWIEFLCEKKKHLLQKKLPEIQSSVSIDSKNEITKKPASVSSTANKRSRSLSPLTCDSRNCVNNGINRKFSYETRSANSPSLLMSIRNVNISPTHISKTDNSNISQCGKDVDDMEDVYCRLYQDRKYRSEGAELLREQNIPKFPHSPNIGKNHSYPVESKKDEFFQRLYQHHEKQKAEQDKLKEDRNRQLVDMSNILMDTSKSFISVEDSHRLADRLNRRLKKTETENAQFREKINNEMDRRAHSKFIKSVSNRKVVSRYKKSLEEIFDVLKLSEEFEKQNFRNTQIKGSANEKSLLSIKDVDLLVGNKYNDDQLIVEKLEKFNNVDDLLIFEHSGTDPIRSPATEEIYPLLNLSEAELLSEESKSTRNKDSISHQIGSIQPTTQFVTINSTGPHIYPLPSDFIEIAYTNPHLLKPKLLADNISIALNMFINEKKNIITKEEFVEQMLRLMFEGKLTPFGYLLTPTDKRNDRKKKHSLRRTEDIEIEEHCTYKPQLKAKNMTTALIEQRYSDRFTGKQKIEDSLLSYIPINARKLDSIRQEVEDDQKLDCTFQPFLQASYNRELRQKQRRSKSVPPPGYYELEDYDFDGSNLQGVVATPLEEWYNL